MALLTLAMECPEPFHDLYHQGAPEDIVGTDRESGTLILACIACRTALKKQ